MIRILLDRFHKYCIFSRFSDCTLRGASTTIATQLQLVAHSSQQILANSSANVTSLLMTSNHAMQPQTHLLIVNIQPVSYAHVAESSGHLHVNCLLEVNTVRSSSSKD